MVSLPRLLTLRQRYVTFCLRGGKDSLSSLIAHGGGGKKQDGGRRRRRTSSREYGNSKFRAVFSFLLRLIDSLLSGSKPSRAELSRTGPDWTGHDDMVSSVDHGGSDYNKLFSDGRSHLNLLSSIAVELAWSVRIACKPQFVRSLGLICICGWTSSSH